MSPPSQHARMGPTALVLGLALLLAAVAGFQARRWRPSPVELGSHSPSRPAASTLPPAPASTRPTSASSTAEIDPNLPLYGGDTRRLAAQAIDDTARSRLNQALLALARRFLGRPTSAWRLEPRHAERLRLDLEQFDQLRFVEQLLALVNSRQVTSRTEAVDRFSDHVRQLRYQDGQVAPCRRHHDLSRWAQAAERRGYLVNLTPFLPGASRQRPLSLRSSPGGAAAPMPPAERRPCLPSLDQSLAVDQAYVPLKGLAQVLPALRSGDLYVLLTQRPGLEGGQVGLVEVIGHQINGLHAATAPEVRRSLDLARYASSLDGVIGLAFYRPVPNPDGQPDR